jgi:transcriptional regulator with XRE-family HTH domain
MTRTEARRLFPERFRKAMQQKGIKQVELGRLLGVRGTTVSEWSRGIRFPSMGQAPGLVEHLETDSLTFLIAAGHTVACEVCGREVTQTKRTRLPRYCSRLCKSTSHSRAERAGRAHEGVIAKQRLPTSSALPLPLHRDQPEGGMNVWMGLVLLACILASLCAVPGLWPVGLVSIALSLVAAVGVVVEYRRATR